LPSPIPAGKKGWISGFCPRAVVAVAEMKTIKSIDLRSMENLRER